MSQEQQHKESDNLKEIAPTLAQHGRNRNYKAPDGYFESLYTRVIARAKNETKHEIISLGSYRKTAIAAAASVAIIILGFGVFTTTVSETSETTLIAVAENTLTPGEELDAKNRFYGIVEENDYQIVAGPEQVADYIENEIFYDYDEEDLILALAEYPKEIAEENEVVEDEIIEYLLMEGIDLDFIISEL